MKMLVAIRIHGKVAAPMLDILRKRKRSWLILIPLGIIIVTFVLFYGGQGSQDPGVENIAEVNGEVIGQQEFALQYQRMLQRYREIFKDSLTPELIRNLNLKSVVLEELIQKRLLLQEARKLGLAATDENLMTTIAQITEFHVNGRFNKERYVQLLRANQLTPGQFESEQRELMTIQKLYSIVLDSVHVSESEVRERYRFDQEKINLYFIPLTLADSVSQVKVSDEEAKNFYDRNKDSLKEPLQVQVEYLSYAFDRYSAETQITEKEIEDYYQANRETKFRTLKEAQVRHILTRVPGGTDPKAKEAARARAERILAEARAGKDFGRLAKENSDDPSAAQGGEVGWLSQGQMLPVLDAVVFNLPKGGISKVVESPAGFHIVKVEDIRDEKVQTLKEARPEILRTLKTEKGKKEPVKAADRHRENILSGADFSQMAKESGVPLKVTRWFANSEVLPDIGPAQEFYKNAFSLSAKELSPVIEGTNAYYLLRVKERREPSVPAFETVRPNIEQRLKQTKGFELVVKKATGLLEQLKKEKNIKALAKEHGLSIDETGWFVRSASQIPKIGNLQEIKPGGILISSHKPIPEQVFTQKESAYVIAFKESQGADMAGFEREKSRHMEEALNESKQSVMQRFVESLKAKAQIQIQAKSLEDT
jgi:peptidyl-prolyl cis-trans isomerase D